MRGYLLLICSTIFCLVTFDMVVADDAGPGLHRDRDWCRNARDGQCSPDKRGGCGKRRGDWYGVRRPVTSVKDATEQFAKYFSNQEMVVAGVLERPWHFEADVRDNCGKVVDRVMIDKRSGRVRSIY